MPILASMTGTGPPFRLVALWVVVCAIAELSGIGLAAAWWIAMDRIDPAPATLALKWLSLGLKSLSGLVEGSILGTLQALVLRRVFPRLPVPRWVALTALVAVFGWAVGSAFPIFGQPPVTGAEPFDPPLGWTLLASGAMGVAVGAVFGAAQAIALRRAATGAGWWIAVNAAGWGLALPVIYAAAGLGPADPALPGMLARALAAGLVAGLILGAVTALGFRLIVPRPA